MDEDDVWERWRAGGLLGFPRGGNEKDEDEGNSHRLVANAVPLPLRGSGKLKLELKPK